ncbi:MAG: DUF3299 domain-containing protein [Pseudomonadota bacterium]
MKDLLTRRELMIASGSLAAFGLTVWGVTSGLGVGERTPALRAGALDLVWDDLLPGGADPLRQTFADLGISEEGQLLGLLDTMAGDAVTSAYNGQRVRIPGYMVPFAFLSTGVTEFLLVPYVGACIHVPPPPANQIVMVTVTTPYETRRYFDAVYVEGMIETEAQTTTLADVGYRIQSAAVTPYR